MGRCPPLVSAHLRTSRVSAQSPLQQFLAETGSNPEALEPLSSVFPRPGWVSRWSFPASTPCPGFPVMVWLLAVTESPGQGGGRTRARGGWARAARKAANDCQSRVFRPYLQGPPITWHQAKTSRGAPATDTPGITPARRREDEAHPSRSGFLPSSPCSLERPQPPSAVQCSPFPPWPSLPRTCI